MFWGKSIFLVIVLIINIGTAYAQGRLHAICSANQDVSCDIRFDDPQIAPGAADKVEVVWPGANGAREEINNFLAYNPNSQTSAWLLLFDRSRSLSRNTIRIIRQDFGSIVNTLRPSEKMGIATFAGDYKLVSKIGSTRNELSQALNGLRPEGNRTLIYKSAEQAIRDLSAFPADRKALVIVSDGKSEDSQEDTAAKITQLANDADIVVYGIGYTQRQRDDRFVNDLIDLARNTQGVSHHAKLYQNSNVMLSQDISNNFLQFLQNGGRATFRRRDFSSDAVSFELIATVNGQEFKSGTITIPTNIAPGAGPGTGPDSGPGNGTGQGTNTVAGTNNTGAGSSSNTGAGTNTGAGSNTGNGSASVGNTQSNSGASSSNVANTQSNVGTNSNSGSSNSSGFFGTGITSNLLEEYKYPIIYTISAIVLVLLGLLAFLLLRKKESEDIYQPAFPTGQVGVSDDVVDTGPNTKTTASGGNSAFVGQTGVVKDSHASFAKTQAHAGSNLSRGFSSAKPTYGWFERLDKTSERINLDKASMSIGRHHDNDIQLTDRSVHRNHASLHLTPGNEIVITDLSPEDGNKLLINGKIHTDKTIVSGDIIELGQVRLRYNRA